MNKNTAIGRLGGVIQTILAVVGGLAIVLLIAAAVFYVWFRPQDVVRVKETLVAPGAQHAATLYVDMGGGAAGWCYQVVAINPSSAPFSPNGIKESLANNVFRGACDSTVKLKWLNATELQIRLPNFVGRTWTSSNLRSRNKTGDVKVVYTFGAENTRPHVKKDNDEAGKRYDF